jgi:ABC-2 type transport system ATP-binding protein
MLEICGLQKVIDGRIVLDIPAFDVTDARTVGVVARAGSGMEPFVDLLIGRSQPTAGTIRLSGLDPYRERRSLGDAMGVMFEDDAVYRNMSTLANLRFQARLHGIPRERAEAVLSQVGLTDQKRAPAGKLSSSLLRRLAFGRAILHKPKFLLLVDPFIRCDDGTVGLFTTLIRTLAEEGAAVLILASHETGLASVCERMFEMQDGRINEITRTPDEEEYRRSFKIPVKIDEKILLVNPSEVLFADASQGRAFLVTAGERFPTQYTLSELEARLKHSGFFRAHRAYLVNLQHVREVIPFTRNAFSLRLDDQAGTQIPLSRTAAAELRVLLDF